MKHPTAWTTPDDITNKLRSYWERGQILAARLSNKPLFPRELPLKKPDARDISERFDSVHKWIKVLKEGSKAGRGFGYEIEWKEINHRQIGRNPFPARVWVATENDALRLIGKRRQAKRFQRLADETLERFPTLREWLTRRPIIALKHASNWERIVDILAWFQVHPRSGLYLRQLDIPGIDTKFIETRKGLLAALLDRVLPPEAVDSRFTRIKGFEQRYGLASKPPLVRFRLLDERLSLQGLTDLMVPAAEFARLVIAAKRVFITENEINGLAFPKMPESLVIFGLGYDRDRIAQAEWLRTKTLYYWGDIDTHGFAILDRLRASFPQAQSFLMDRETLMVHRDLWVRENDRHPGPLDRLTTSEQMLFDELRRDVLGEGVRLEQERMPFGRLQQALAALPVA